jgi:hypothetical protein
VNPVLYTLLRNAFFAPEHDNETLDSAARFQSVLDTLHPFMSANRFDRGIRNSALTKLIEVFKLPDNVLSISIDIPADGLAELNVTRLLTSAELQAFADWVESEDVQVAETVTTSGTLYTPDPSDA